MTRTVVLLCGAPGSGKSYAAALAGCPVYDADDPQWSSRAVFTQALRELAATPNARAVVIRCAATGALRDRAADQCKATHRMVMPTPQQVCLDRVTARDRGDTVAMVAAVAKWFHDTDRADAAPDYQGINELLNLTTNPNNLSEQW